MKGRKPTFYAVHTDKRKQRRMYRRSAKNILLALYAGALSGPSPAMYQTAEWYLKQARYLGR